MRPLPAQIDVSARGQTSNCIADTSHLLTANQTSQHVMLVLLLALLVNCLDRERMRRNAEVEAQIAHLRAELLHKEQENERVQTQLAQEKAERERAERQVCLCLSHNAGWHHGCMSAVCRPAWPARAAACAVAEISRRTRVDAGAAC